MCCIAFTLWGKMDFTWWREKASPHNKHPWTHMALLSPSATHSVFRRPHKTTVPVSPLPSLAFTTSCMCLIIIRGGLLTQTAMERAPPYDYSSSNLGLAVFCALKCGVQFVESSLERLVCRIEALFAGAQCSPKCGWHSDCYCFNQTNHF